MSLLANVRLSLTLLAVAANALTAGGIFTFPIMSPALATNLQLNQLQLTTIVLAGMIGQYPAAAVVGYVVDVYGPWATSLLASLLFGVGFGCFSFIISNIPQIEPLSHSAVDSTAYLLAFMFLLCGLGTVNSYFSALFAATKLLPRHPALAAGVSMGLFGLSPLLLTFFAGRFFNTTNDGLDVTAYTRFLAILTLTVNLFGALCLNPSHHAQESTNHSSASVANTLEADESAPLLPSMTKDATDPKTNMNGVLRDPSFWMLALVAAMTLGSSEMVISNIGTIVLSLPPEKSATILSPVVATVRQVRLLSLSNTFSRLLIGFTADWISPVGGVSETTPNKTRKISRIVFLVAFSLILTFTYLWTTVYVRNQAALWWLSVGVGVSYGAIFTILPTLVSAFWGISNMARNFGLITYAPFLFTPAFSYLYAFLSEYNAETVEDGLSRVCYGSICWRTCFIVCSLAGLLASISGSFLWRRWKGKV